MLKKLGLPALALGVALTILSPASVLARDHDRDDDRGYYGRGNYYGYQMSPHEWHEYQEHARHERHEERERARRFYNRGYYNGGYYYSNPGYYTAPSNGYYDQWGNWHPYNNGYYDQWGNWHPYGY